jgi:type 1 glutamine amidotransferase
VRIPRPTTITWAVFILVARTAAAVADGGTSPNADVESLRSTPTQGYGYGWWTPLAAAPSTLHWRFAVELSDFSDDYHKALLATSAVKKLSNYVGSASQRVSLMIARPLGPGLYPQELYAVSHWSPSIIAYRVASIPDDEDAARQLFAFARTMKIETIITEAIPARIGIVDMLASEYDVSVALRAPLPRVLEALAHAGPRLGACLNTAALAEERSSVDQVLEQLHDRIQIVELQKRSVSSRDEDFGALLKAIHSHASKPSLFIIRADVDSGSSSVASVQRNVDSLDEVLRPLLAEAASQASRNPTIGRLAETPEQHIQLAAFAGNSTFWDPATPDRRAAIDAALPKQAIMRPKKPRKLLVIDLNLSYPGHNSIPTNNYGIAKLGSTTGAYEAVFDNNLDNLKYPAIRQYDAIFLNNAIGPIFEDPQVRAGLIRFVREGGGFGGTHAATHVAIDWPEFGEMLGATAGEEEGVAEKMWLKIDDPKSPLNAGFQGKEFQYQDQFFRFIGPPYSRDTLHVLLSVDVQKTDMFQLDDPTLGAKDVTAYHSQIGRKDSDYAISWIREYGQGRVFYTTLGHSDTLFTTHETAQHMLAGLQYILGDLPADATPSNRVSASAKH